jgi:hypothetical protein
MNTVRLGKRGTPDLQSDVRAKVVKLIEIVYWLVIFEGALRKWVLVPIAKPLFFVRDPFVLYIYYLAWQHDLFPKNNLLFKLSLILAGIFVGLFAFQSVIGREAIATGIYGWRMYFFLMPLAFIAGDLLNGQDIKRIVRRTLVVAIPMAAIVILQYRSPPTSFINKMIDSDTGFVYGEFARASGTFSFTQGHELFCHSVMAMLVAVVLMPTKWRPLPPKWLYGIGFCVIVNVLLNGNRGVLALAAIVLLSSLVYRIGIARQKLTVRMFTPEIVCAVAFLLYTTVFGSSYQAMSERMSFRSGNQNEGLARIVGIFNAVPEAVGRTRLSGGGLGLGTSGGRALSGNQSAVGYFDENELGRIIDECGPVGLLYILYRFFIAGYILLYAYKASKRSHNPVPFMLASFPAWIFMTSFLTFNGTTNGYGWVFLGFCLAANKIGLPANTARETAA